MHNKCLHGHLCHACCLESVTKLWLLTYIMHVKSRWKFYWSSCTDLWFWLINHGVPRSEIDRKSKKFMFNLKKKNFQCKGTKLTLDGSHRVWLVLSVLPDLPRCEELQSHALAARGNLPDEWWGILVFKMKGCCDLEQYKWSCVFKCLNTKWKLPFFKSEKWILKQHRRKKQNGTNKLFLLYILDTAMLWTLHVAQSMWGKGC